jgi:hypothetical protein
MEMQQLRDRFLSQMVKVPAAEVDESEIEAELAALKLSEPGWEVQARKFRLMAELTFRQNGGGSNAQSGRHDFAG